MAKIKFQKEEYDNLGNLLGPSELQIKLDPPVPHLGVVSESLVEAAKHGLRINGLDSSGVKITLELEYSVAGKSRFVNGHRIMFGARTGGRLNIGFRTEKEVWYYSKEFREILESLSEKENNHWAAVIHTYHRT